MNRRRAAVAAIAILVAAVATGLCYRGKIRAFLYRNYAEVRAVTGSNWFDYPVGAPNAKGYYRAQRFGGASSHLGEDWNGMGGGDSDYGDPVYAIADGCASSAGDCGGGWGNVVRIIHPVAGDDLVEAVYAHLSKMEVRERERVRRGQFIGRIGNVDGLYQAHLHFEIRKKPGLPLGCGYGPDPENVFLDPTRFIDRHRKRRPSP